jgi:GNAT superfamily N-acetyltransferase
MASIDALGPGDQEAVETARVLLNRLLGDNLYPPAKAARVAGDDEALLLAAREGGEVLGAAVCRLLYPSDADYYHAFGGRVLELFSHYRVGSLEALAVTPGRQRQGLGTRLTRSQMAWLEQRGCGVAVTISWSPGGTSASAPLYERLGFVGSPWVQDFYLDESIADKWTCPYCKGPCHCAGALYYARLQPAGVVAR